MTTPLFSVVIPTFARPAALRGCLTALAETGGRVPFEVLVVDDGSPQPVRDLVGDTPRLCDVRWLRQANRGPGPARNAGASAARGRYLAFTDDDCRPRPGWLDAFARVLIDDERRLVGGPVENALTDNVYAEASQHIARFVYDYNARLGAAEPFFTSNNMAMSAARFQALGGFTTRIPSGTAEDKELCDRWRANGLPLVRVPDAVVDHAHDLTFARFVRQHFNYGRGILAFRFLRRSRGGNSIVPEPAAFYLELLRSAWSDHASAPRGRLAALVLLSQTATAAGALREAVHWRRLKRLAGTPAPEAQP